ncbi:MAG: hypothetical protein NT062_39385, partial [Proteobacteria bacterium]|nr:hypothetical protein [Pseudomonadota bacterium]
MKPVIWVSKPLQHMLCERTGGIVVSSAKEFLDATRDPKMVSFVDDTTLEIIAEIDHVTIPGTIIAICDESLQNAVNLFQYPWLSHVVSKAMLEHPMAELHFPNILQSIGGTNLRLLDWLEPTVTGRRVRLTHANKRVARLERMSEFFEGKGIGKRHIELLQNVAEELLTNAFYDAPVAAGALKPVSRTEDVALPDDSACDLAYGCRDDLVFVRVR